MNKNEFRALQELKYKTGQIDRRTFVRSLLATSVALPTALSIAGSVEAATPKRGGLLRVGMGHGSTTDTLDPGTHENGHSMATRYACSNHLAEVGPDGQLRRRESLHRRFLRPGKWMQQYRQYRWMR